MGGRAYLENNEVVPQSRLAQEDQIYLVVNLLPSKLWVSVQFLYRLKEHRVSVKHDIRIPQPDVLYKMHNIPHSKHNPLIK